MQGMRSVGKAGLRLVRAKVSCLRYFSLKSILSSVYEAGEWHSYDKYFLLSIKYVQLDYDCIESQKTTDKMLRT